ncbi:hypothetical protein ACFE04_020376 [Oxalis oulophora]
MHGVYTYVAQWPIYSLAWSLRRDNKSRLAIGSYLEDYSNKVEIVNFDPHTSDFTTNNRLIFDHPYAPTNLMFFPSQETSNPDLIATSGDYLRLWEIHDDRIELKSLLNNNKESEFNSPLTSFDWAELDPRRVATCSIDTTCTVWDIERLTVDSQLVAHDKEVYDISWGGYNVFASVSGDGSIRVFDLRDKEKSTIIYENLNNNKADTSSSSSSSSNLPLLRIEWNKSDPRLMAAVGMDSNKVVIMDIRFPTNPLMELRKHRAAVNAVSWAPYIGRQICSVADDSTALIWGVVCGGGGELQTEMVAADVEPETLYQSTAEINQVRWSPVDLDWISIAFSNKLQLLKACALYNNWWPMLSALMYVIVPMPCLFFGGGSTQFLISRDGGGWIDAAKFMTGASAVGSMAIPIILRHAELIETGAMFIEFTSFFIFVCTVMCFHRASLEDDW